MLYLNKMKSNVAVAAVVMSPINGAAETHAFFAPAEQKNDRIAKQELYPMMIAKNNGDWNVK